MMMMGSSENEVNVKAQELFDALTERTKHQYKSYYGRYIKWCEDNKLISHTSNKNEIFKSLPLSSRLFHCFLLDIYISKNTKNGDNDKSSLVSDPKENFLAENISVKISTLKKIISSLKFLVRICDVYNNDNVSKVDDKYLENITKLHTYWYNLVESISNTINLTNTYPPLLRVSMNMWNPQTLNLNEKVFKTTSEKLRFLIDFHFTNYLNLSYNERAELKLSDLRTNKEMNIIEINKFTDASQITPMILLPQDCPFLCPLTSLAASLFLRFYGIKNVYKGDGFPDVSKCIKPNKLDYHKEAKLSANVVYWQDLPLIRGKSPLDYPKDVTMSSYYNMIFRYCHLPYKRREYFQDRQTSFPTWNKKDFENDSENYKHISEKAFQYNVPHDFMTILNHKSPYTSYESLAEKITNVNTLPSHLLVQLFPEVEYFKHSRDTLSPEALEFINVIEALRNTLLKNLPWLYHFFPHHDIFNDTVLTNPEFQKYFQEVTEKFRENGEMKLPFNILQGYDNLTENELYNVLVEPPFRTSTAPNSQLVTLTSAVDVKSGQPLPNDGMNQIVEMIKTQSMSKNKIIIDGLQNIFKNINIDESSKNLALQKLKSLEENIITNIGPTIKEETVKSEFSELKSNTILNKIKNIPSVGLLDLDSSSDEESDCIDVRFKNNKKVNPTINYDERGDDSDEDQDNLQEELKFMVNELVGEKVRSTMKTEMNEFERKITDMVDIMVEKKLNGMINKQLVDLEAKIMNNLQKRTIEDVEIFNTEHDSAKRRNDYDNSNMPPAKKPNNDLKTNFTINSSIDSIEDIIYEWFTPNPDMDNECIHSMNKKYGKEWRVPFETLYRQRKIIIELYIYLVNQAGCENVQAVQMIESLSDRIQKNESTGDSKFFTLANFLKSWKRQHNNSFKELKF